MPAVEGEAEQQLHKPVIFVDAEWHDFSESVERLFVFYDELVKLKEAGLLGEEGSAVLDELTRWLLEREDPEAAPKDAPDEDGDYCCTLINPANNAATGQRNYLNMSKARALNKCKAWAHSMNRNGSLSGGRC